MAEYLANMLTLSFGCPAVQHLTYWGGPTALFYPKSAQPSAVLNVYNQLVAGLWHSKGTTTIGADGAAKINGYKGQYAIHLAPQSISQSNPSSTLALKISYCPSLYV
jgi:hypothetical protein